MIFGLRGYENAVQAKQPGNSRKGRYHIYHVTHCPPGSGDRL